MVESLKKSGFNHALNMRISGGATLTLLGLLTQLNLSHSFRVGWTEPRTGTRCHKQLEFGFPVQFIQIVAAPDPKMLQHEGDTQVPDLLPWGWAVPKPLVLSTGGAER